MDCTKCGRTFVASAFPGGHVSCACGADLVVPRAAPLASRPVPAVHAASPTDRDAVETPHACPRCRHPLDPLPDRDGYACGSCTGRLLRHAALKQILAEANDEHDRAVAAGALAAPRPAAHLEADVHYLSCPDCRDLMSRMNFGGSSGIIVDVCKTHGTWLDAGELTRTTDFVRGHGLGQKPRATEGPQLSPENQAALRRAEALMQYEVLGEQQRAAHVIEAFDDVVHMLFGSPWRGPW